jgi:hypothetical protein
MTVRLAASVDILATDLIAKVRTSMRKVEWLLLSLCLVVLPSEHSAGQIEELFGETQTVAQQSGLILEIAVPKQTYFFFEPVTVFARFTNVTDRAIALVLEDNSLSGIESKLSWASSQPDGRQHSPDIAGSTLQNVFLIPRHQTLYFALPDKLFPIGTTTLSVQYSHSHRYKQPPLVGVEIWQGQVKSNELTLVVQDKQNLSPEEKLLVDDKIQRHVELFGSEDWRTRYLAANHLVRMPKYSVPVLVECLKHQNSLVRLSAIDALARIADPRIAEQVGFERNTSFLDDLLSAYERERLPLAKRNLVCALGAFRDAGPGERPRILKTLRKAMDHTDKSVRTAGAVILLETSRDDGIPEVIDRMKDSTYFGDEGQQVVLRVLREKTGQDFGMSISEWKAWWRENKGKTK